MATAPVVAPNLPHSESNPDLNTLNTPMDSSSNLVNPTESAPPVTSAANPPDTLSHQLSSRSPSPSSHGEQDDEYQGALAEEDAVGSPDEDVIMTDVGDSPASSPLTNESSDSLKRKRPDRATEQFSELTGQNWVRRSERASRPARQVIESSDESDSDVDTRSAAKRRKNKHQPPQPSERPTPTLNTPQPGDEESDGDFESKRQKQRRKYQNKKASAFAFTEARNPSRRAAQTTSYVDDGDEDEYDEDEVAEWTFADEGDESQAVTVGEILNYRRSGSEDTLTPYLARSDEDIDACPDKSQYEYLVRFEGRAHYAAEWLDHDTIMTMPGKKRLNNYYAKVIVDEYVYYNDPDISAEDKEGKVLERNKLLDTFEEHKIIERVVEHSYVDGTLHYYVKWKGLFYDFCTWELASFVEENALTAVDKYKHRVENPPVTDRSQMNPLTRRQHKESYFKQKRQPGFLTKGEMRDFQLTGLDFLALNWGKNDNVILADEMGLGKTVQTICFLEWLRHERNVNGPFLVVVPTSTIPAWADTFDYWAPTLNYVVYNGNLKAREIIREKELFVNGDPKKTRFNVLLTSYEFVNTDIARLAPVKWQYLAVDEAHRLKNPASNLYVNLISCEAANRLLITGTPVQNNLGELRALMDFCNPGREIVGEDIVLDDVDASARLEALNLRIKPFLLRRTKDHVLKDLPEKKEKIIRVEMADLALDYYKNILARNHAALSLASRGEKFSLMNIMIELKKASNHPYLFPGAEESRVGSSPSKEDELRGLVSSSGKMMLLDQLLPKLKRDGHRVLIFSQFVGVLDILGDYLSKRGHFFQRLDGNVATGARNTAINHFNASDSEDFAFLLSTRAGGLGINLATADTVIIYDSDWNPQADLQAMGRAHRIGQTKPVTVYRLVSRDTVEEEILERARNKLMLEYITIQRNMDGTQVKSLTNEIGRAGVSTDAPQTNADISAILKKRGQKMFEQSGNQKRLEELDIDNVLANAEDHVTKQAEGMGANEGEDFLKSFEITDIKLDETKWEDIIPREEIERVQREEAEKLKKEQEKKARGLMARKRKFTDSYKEDDHDAEVPVKKRSRESNTGEKKKKTKLDDPKRELSKEEIKNLVEAQLRWGYFDERKDKIVAEAKLADRDIDGLKRIVDEVHQIASSKVDAEKRRLDAIVDNGGTANKKDQKSILFDYKGAFSGKQLNADTIVQRTKSLHILKEAVDHFAKDHDVKDFRVEGVHNPTKWTAEWGPIEDAMLCVGTVRYGYNGWQEMETDESLGLEGHMFLREHHVAEAEKRKDQNGKPTPPRTPGSVHLGRRIEYLCMVLRDQISNGEDDEAYAALQNYHRSNKKPVGVGAARRLNHSSKPTSSPAPAPARKNGVEGGHVHKRTGSGNDVRRRELGLAAGSGGGRSQSPHIGSKPSPYASLKSAKRNREDSNGRESERPVSRRSESLATERKAANGKPSMFDMKSAKSPSHPSEGKAKPDPKKRAILAATCEYWEKNMAPGRGYSQLDRQHQIEKLKGYFSRAQQDIARASPEQKDGGAFENECWSFLAKHFWSNAKSQAKDLALMSQKLAAAKDEVKPEAKAEVKDEVKADLKTELESKTNKDEIKTEMTAMATEGKEI